MSSCATAAKPPVISKITFLSMKPAIVEDWIVMGNYHSESFEVEGYKIQFKSDQEIAPENEGNFINLDFYECNSLERYEDGHVYSAKDYTSFSNSQATIIERKPDGTLVYEAQLMSERLQRVEPPICVKIFVLDGKINRKVWRPSYISNAIMLDF
ncbi:MAG: hypothetical protein ABJG88_09510 [Litorimonas sp.]